jgi:hypothetical protein
MASEQDGLSFCSLAQVSIADLRSIDSRTVRVGSCPVAGRPRPRFFVSRELTLAHFVRHVKCERAGEKRQLLTSPNPSHGGTHGSG